MTEDSVESIFTERFLSPRSLENLTPGEAIDVMLRFYAEQPADGLFDGDMSDMLLFQWGTYEWADGKSFDFEVTRQLIFGNGEDEDIYQLSLSFRFPPTEELNLIAAGNRWCESRAELEDFRNFVLRSAAYTSIDKKPASSVDLYYGVTG